MTLTSPSREGGALRRVALLLLTLGIACGLRAQSTGAIQGRIFNPAKSEYVRDAEVRLDGTNQVTYSENDGAFS
ncbi:MAG: hypothetical protein ACKOTF_15040, partial [Opitutaceae bacterium]